MAVAFVQAIAGPTEADASVSVSFGTLPTIGNRIIVAVAGRGNFGTADMSVSDNQGHTYSTANTVSEPTARTTGLYYCDVTTSSGTFTVTVTNAAEGWADPYTLCGAAEFSGVGALDQTTTPASSFGGTHDTGNLGASSASGSLEVACCYRDSATALAVDSFTPAYSNATNNTTLSMGLCFSYRELTSSTNVGCTWGSSGADWTAVGATFAASGGGGATYVPPTIRVPLAAVNRAGSW